MLPSEQNLVKAAMEFCAWAESIPHDIDADTNAKMALNLLSRIYVAALDVKQTGDGGDSEGMRISDERRKKVYESAGALPFNYYNAFFSPANLEETDPVVCDLADDIADIYRDLSEGISQYNQGHESDALWSLKQTFRIHWGRHAASAIYALHAYFADEYGDL